MSLLYWSLSEVAARPRFSELVDEVSDDIMSGLKADEVADDIWAMDDDCVLGFAFSELDVFERGDMV